jgi:uncharacterized membrane protein
MGHSHHTHGDIKVPVRTQRMLLAALLPFVVATVVGAVVLWPTGEGVSLERSGPMAKEFKASVKSVELQDCPDVPGQENFICSQVTVELAEGEDAGQTFTIDYSTGPRTRTVEEGDDVIVGSTGQPQEGSTPGVQEAPKYYLQDFDRRTPLLALGIVFALVVIGLSRWRGLAALAGLAVSLLVLVKFVLPAILEGSDPLSVALVGGAMIMFMALYLAHGFNPATTTAVLGTFASLLLTGVLALFFVNISIFTGAGSEEAAFLQISQQQVNLQGLLLASIVIGTLGVLDDVTVTQASAVWELQKANPAYRMSDLYGAAIRIGRDHIASTVNTLVLTYAAASLPLLILFSVSNRALDHVLNIETVAEEIVRTLVGSIGLVASVPITTGLAVLVVTSGKRSGRHSRPPAVVDDPEDPGEADPLGEYQPPRRERDFWDER